MTSFIHQTDVTIYKGITSPETQWSVSLCGILLSPFSLHNHYRVVDFSVHTYTEILGDSVPSFRDSLEREVDSRDEERFMIYSRGFGRMDCLTPY